MRYLFFVILGSLVVAIVACGPSIRRTYQSDNAFERCFEMDFNPGASVEDKQQCWSKWKRKYVYNQQADKVRYADMRIEELANGVSIPAPPGPPGAFDKRPLPDTDVDTESNSDDSCGIACKDVLSSCLDICQAPDTDTDTDFKSQSNCTHACSAGYQTCLSNCKK